MDHRPLEGFVLAISPFNFTSIGGNLAAAPAIVGNTVVWKPATTALLAAQVIMEILEAAGLPPGVLNVVPGPAREVASVLISDPRVRMITFTGSTQVGKLIAVEAAKHLKKITLEMGGKNPLIVLRDADVDYAVRAGCFGIYFH